jgi:hypothetical protein
MVDLATGRPPEVADDKVRCASCRRALATSTNHGSLMVVQNPSPCGCAGAVVVHVGTADAG